MTIFIRLFIIVYIQESIELYHFILVLPYMLTDKENQGKYTETLSNI